MENKKYDEKVQCSQDTKDTVKVDTGMMSQKQRAQFISYMEESLKEAKRDGR